MGLIKEIDEEINVYIEEEDFSSSCPKLTEFVQTLARTVDEKKYRERTTFQEIFRSATRFRKMLDVLASFYMQSAYPAEYAMLRFRLTGAFSKEENQLFDDTLRAACASKGEEDSNRYSIIILTPDNQPPLYGDKLHTRIKVLGLSHPDDKSHTQVLDKLENWENTVEFSYRDKSSSNCVVSCKWTSDEQIPSAPPFSSLEHGKKTDGEMEETTYKVNNPKLNFNRYGNVFKCKLVMPFPYDGKMSAEMRTELRIDH